MGEESVDFPSIISVANIMKRLTARIYGHVQGVFFRDTTRRQAQQRDITGWVRNERDGTVQVVAEGAEQDLEQMLDFLHRGPSAARVDRVEAEWQSATGEFTTFQVRR